MSFGLFLVLTVYQGVMLACVAACAFDAWANRSKPARGAAIYVLISAAVSAGVTGWLVQLHSASAAGQSAWWGLGVPVTTLAGVSGVRHWLGLAWRKPELDLAVRWSQRLLLLLCGVGAISVLATGSAGLSAAQSYWANWVPLVVVPVGAVLCMLPATHAARIMAKHGDRLANWMAWACHLTFLGLSLTWLRTNIATGLADWVLGLAAVSHAGGTMAIAYAAIVRGQLRSRRRQALDNAENFDALLRLPTGRPLESAMRRIAKDRKLSPPAVLVVNVFNHQAIGVAFGRGAIDQLLLASLARIQGSVPSHCLVGRFVDACFVIMPGVPMHAQGLRILANSLVADVNRDIALRGEVARGLADPRLVLDIGVGICWSEHVQDVSQALRQAGMAAETARSEEGRAAVCLYPNKPALPIDTVLVGDDVFSKPPSSAGIDSVSAMDSSFLGASPHMR